MKQVIYAAVSVRPFIVTLQFRLNHMFITLGTPLRSRDTINLRSMGGNNEWTDGDEMHHRLKYRSISDWRVKK